MQYNPIPCNTMQYHTSFITADGAYHCPVGSTWPFFPTAGKSMLPEKLLKCAIAQFSRTFKIRCKVQACYEYPPRRDQAHAILFISKFIP